MTVRRCTWGSGLCGSPEEVVACQCWEERASTWSGCSTHSEAKASHSVGVVKHVAAHDLSLSCKRVKLMIFSAIAALLTFAQASESLPYKAQNSWIQTCYCCIIILCFSVICLLLLAQLVALIFLLFILLCKWPASYAIQ